MDRSWEPNGSEPGVASCREWSSVDRCGAHMHTGWDRVVNQSPNTQSEWSGQRFQHRRIAIRVVYCSSQIAIDLLCDQSELVVVIAQDDEGRYPKHFFLQLLMMLKEMRGVRAKQCVLVTNGVIIDLPSTDEAFCPAVHVVLNGFVQPVTPVMAQHDLRGCLFQSGTQLIDKLICILTRSQGYQTGGSTLLPARLKHRFSNLIGDGFTTVSHSVLEHKHRVDRGKFEINGCSRFVCGLLHRQSGTV